jgi:hypothetical protein
VVPDLFSFFYRAGSVTRAIQVQELAQGCENTWGNSGKVAGDQSEAWRLAKLCDAATDLDLGERVRRYE